MTTQKELQKELIGLGNQIRAKGIEEGNMMLSRQYLTDMIMFEHDSSHNSFEDKWNALKEHIQNQHKTFKRNFTE